MGLCAKAAAVFSYELPVSLSLGDDHLPDAAPVCCLDGSKSFDQKEFTDICCGFSSLAFLLARPVYQTNQLRTQKLSPKKLLQTKLARQGLDPLLSVLNYGSQADYLPVVKKGPDIGKAYRKQIASRWQSFGHQVLPRGKQQLSWTSKGGKVICR